MTTSKNKGGIPPVFLVKTEIDPFYLYGSLSNPQIFSEAEEIEDIRLRLATLKAKNDLELKAGEKSQLQNVAKQVNNDKKIISKGFEFTTDHEPDMIIKYRQKIKNSFKKIENKFTEIFSLLLDISKNPGSLVPDGDIAVDRANNRSREFNSRIKRCIFELKQQVIVLRSSILKMGLHPNERHLQSRCLKQLSVILKQVVLMLDMYHRHLPHSGGQVYSDVLEQGLDQIGNVILLSDLINCSTWNILDDVRRLAHFSAGLNKTMLINIGQKNERKKLSKDDVVKNRVREMMMNLARQKFGDPPLDEESRNLPLDEESRNLPLDEESRNLGASISTKNSKNTDKSLKQFNKKSIKSSKIKTPRETKLTLFRARHSRSKLLGTTPTENDLKSESFFSDTLSHKSFRTQSSKISFDQISRQSNVKNTNVDSTTNLPYKSLSDDDNLQSKNFLEVSDNELKFIISNKRQFLIEKKERELTSAFFTSKDSDVIVGNVSSEIVNELVENVCHEIFDSKLINELIQLEMKE